MEDNKKYIPCDLCQKKTLFEEMVEEEQPKTDDDQLRRRFLIKIKCQHCDNINYHARYTPKARL